MSRQSVHQHRMLSARTLFSFVEQCSRWCRQSADGTDVTANLIGMLAFSQLDYSNALLAGLPRLSLMPYQHVINAAVRLMSGLWLHNHVTLAVTDLHSNSSSQLIPCLGSSDSESSLTKQKSVACDKHTVSSCRPQSYMT